jgi:hypothetical protein
MRASGGSQAMISVLVVVSLRQLHANETGLHPAKQHQKLVATNLPAKHQPTFAIDAMNLENVLRDIHADRSNLHEGGSFPLMVS